MVEVLAGNPTEAEAWLVRADGLSTTGAPLAGRLILAVLADDEARIARAVRDLRRETPPWTSSATPVYLAGLEQRYGEARALVEAGLQNDPTASRLWLASAALDALAGVSASSTNANVTTIPGLDPAAWLGPEAAQRLPRIAGASEPFARRVLALLLATDAPVWHAGSANRAADRTFTEQLGPFAAELQLDQRLTFTDQKLEWRLGKSNWFLGGDWRYLNTDVTIIGGGAIGAAIAAVTWKDET